VIGLIKENFDTPLGGDLVFQEISNDQYKVWENTSKGKNLIKKYQEFFIKSENNEKEKTAPQIPSGESLNEWSQGMRQFLLDPELLAKAVEWSRDHKIWDELAETCLGCGICTYVCPLCHCFSIEDRVGLDDKCSRCRKWDACTLPEFSKIAGGHSFRPTLKERYYNWFYHKFVRAYKEYGKSQCVGCSACKNNCPAGIDIQEILKRIIKDYQQENE
ncbi:4Fe-4S dicluster domain-containing protein, partial [Patescibacteria group bacterium]|nr:4Fe-4S dicluster domain-containing protein [Patescibacteria group bacterium]